MAESEGKLKSLLMRVKEEREKAGIWSHHFMANEGVEGSRSNDLSSLALQNHCRWLTVATRLEDSCFLKGRL